MPEVELYWGSGSPYAWRVLLALELRKIPYQSHLLSFSKGEHKTAEFLAMNPRGKVPTLKYGDVVVYESMAIIAWLERTFTDHPSLYGDDPASSARIMTRSAEVEAYGQNCAGRYVGPLFFGTHEANHDDIEAALPKIREEMNVWETWARDEWLGGDSISMVDVMVLPVVENLLRAAGKPAATRYDLPLLPLSKTFPKLAAWHTRFQALPAFEAAYPPHWRG